MHQAQPVRQGQLAHVVHQRPHPQVHHLGPGQAQLARQQQRDDAHVHCMRGRAVAGGFAQHAHAGLAVHQHLVQQRAGELLGAFAGQVGLAGHGVVDAPQVAAGLAVLALAQAQRGLLGGQLALGGLARLGARDHGRRGGARVGVIGRRAGRRIERQRALLAGSTIGRVAAFRVPAQLLQAERADGLDLLGGADLEAGQGKRVRHPAQIQVDEHSDAQILN